MTGIDANFLIACELDEHSHHQMSRALLNSLAEAGEQFAIAPQVIAEFLHIVTDGKRLKLPRTMEQALEKAEAWRTAVDVVMLFPEVDAVDLFFHWMSKFQLGRKRILDTLLAATYATKNVPAIATIDAADFRVFGVFKIVTPRIKKK